MCLYQQGGGSIPTGFKWLRISIWDMSVIEVSNKQELHLFPVDDTHGYCFSFWCTSIEKLDHADTFLRNILPAAVPREN